MKPTITWILIADGARARFMSNSGPGKGLEALPDLVFEGDHKPTIDADRPGRTFDSVGEGRHAMAPVADPHELLKAQFVDQLAATLEQHADAFDRLVLVAPPHILGMLRKSMPDAVAAKVTGELGKDLTHTPNTELPKHLQEVIAL